GCFLLATRSRCEHDTLRLAQANGFGSLPTNLIVKTTDNMIWTVTFSGNTDDGLDGFSSLKDGVYDMNVDAAKVHPLGDPTVSMATASSPTPTTCNSAAASISR